MDMKEFFGKTKVKILLSVLLVLLMISVFTKDVENNAVSSVFNGISYGLSKVTAAATGNNVHTMSYDELLDAYKDLQKENAELRTQVVDYYDTKAENTRLWKFYDLKKEHADYTLVPAKVLRRDVNDEFSAFTLDKGTASGVNIGDPVVTDNGVVGWVSEADANTAKVTTVLSPGTSIGAVDNKSKDTGIVTGRAKYADQGQMAFTKLSPDNKVKEGDIITTTGISGLYPKGLILGEVKEVCYDTYDSSYYAVITPYDTIKKLTDAAVITEFSGQDEILIKGGADE